MPLALAAMAAALALQLARHAESLARYDRFVLPAFDARVYLAMAEAPAVFTRAPWGYRLLGPWLVSLLPGAPGTGAFLAFALACLWAAGGLLYLWLRRLGHADWTAVLAVAACGLAAPVEAAVAVPFLTEPLAIALLLAFLLALEAGAPLALLALAALLGTLAKGAVFLLFVPLVFFARSRAGLGRALGASALVALPALLAQALLRLAWVPHIGGDWTWPAWDSFWLALYRVLAGAGSWWQAALLGGLAPLALLGALRRAARPFLRRYAWLLGLTWALPFAASVYTGDGVGGAFFADDIPRLLLYALPGVLHLALVALDRVRPQLGQAPLAPRRAPAWTSTAAAAGVLASLAVLALGLDRYRRVDLAGGRDGPLVLAVERGSLDFARRLALGLPVDFRPAQRRFLQHHDVEHMRWFLRDGWGPSPHYGLGPVTMQATQAQVLLPCLRPAAWRVTLALRAPRRASVSAAVNGQAVGGCAAAAGPQRCELRVPATALFRGDNLLTLTAAREAPQVELLELRVVP